MLSFAEPVAAVSHTRSVRRRTLGSPRRRAAALWLPQRFLALLVVLAALVSGAQADAPAGGGGLPADYTREQIGAVRYTFPLRARDEVRELQAYQPGAWQRIVRELGARIPAELDIRIARNPTEMQQLAPSGVPLPGYAEGIAFPKQGLVLLTLTAPRTWLRPDMRRVLTHELSHVALERAAGGTPVPRWFTEGVAVYQAGESSLTRVRTLWEGTLQGRLLPLEQLSRAFPLRHGDVDLAYAQSADFVSFMLGGADERARFRDLLTQLSRGVAFEEAVKTAYHVPLGYMEREWRTALTQRYGRWPALLMGLTFVWAVGAILLLVGYVRARRKHARTLERWAVEEAPAAAVPPPVPQAALVHATTASLPVGASREPAQTSQPTGPVDEFFENRRQQSDSGVPTVVHDGQSHTLH